MDICRSLYATTNSAIGRRHCRLQMNRFQEHLQRIGQAISLVDHRPPRLPVSQMGEVFAKYASWALELPTDRVVLMRLLRPWIVLYFGLMDGRSLGRVVVQLYTEAAPLLVLQFIRTCRRQRAHEFAMRRIFPNLWLEGYLLGQPERSANAPPRLSDPMEYDTRVLSHAGHNCVLSCAKEYCVHGFPGGAINFSISFKPLSVANGQRVGFGRVVRGNKIVKCMQTYGTKNGKMSRTLVITHCDVL